MRFLSESTLAIYLLQPPLHEHLVRPFLLGLNEYAYVILASAASLGLAITCCVMARTILGPQRARIWLRYVIINYCFTRDY